MSDPQKEAFIEQEQTGILSLPIDIDTAPFSLPLTFAYDKNNNRIIFQFVIHEDSTKMEFIREGVKATLSVVEQLAGMGWISVALMGTMGQLTGEEIGIAESIFEESTMGEVNVFPDRDDYHVEWWALQLEETRGRYSKAHGLSLVD